MRASRAVRTNQAAVHLVARAGVATEASLPVAARAIEAQQGAVAPVVGRRRLNVAGWCLLS